MDGMGQGKLIKIVFRGVCPSTLEQSEIKWGGGQWVP